MPYAPVDRLLYKIHFSALTESSPAHQRQRFPVPESVFSLSNPYFFRSIRISWRIIHIFPS
jgi:hypothetical protein